MVGVFRNPHMSIFSSPLVLFYHIYRPGSIFRTENLMFLAIAYMFTDPMITLTDMFSAWETMCAGQLRSMTWATGDMRV